MAGAKFDILFAGELIGDADPNVVRRQLQQRFKLSDEAAATLFSGRIVTIKQGVDTAAAGRYREVFRDAGALIDIRPIESPPEIPPIPTAKPTREPAGAPREGPSDSEPEEPGQGSRLVPAAQDGEAIEPQPVVDFSHLSLVQGEDWTLEDCQPSPVVEQLPDTSHLELVAPAHDGGEEPEG